MTSRERVLKTFNHEAADRVPINAFFNQAVKKRVMEYFGVTDDEGLNQALNVDFRGVGAPYTGKRLFPERPDRWVDPVYGHVCKWIEHKTGGYWDFCDFPLQNAEPDVIANWPVFNPDDFDYTYVEQILKRHPDKALHIGNAGNCDIINATGRVMGMEDTLVNLFMRDEATLSYITRRCKAEVENFSRILEQAKGRVDFMWIGEDLGSQDKPMISMDLYREVFKPLHMLYVDLAKSYNIPVMVHTCGASSWVYEEFIGMGIKAVDTLQPEAKDMSPKSLVERFGGRLCFHGCISTAGPLAYGKPEDVRNEMLRVMEIMKPTKAYMMSPTHAIQDNSPTENVIEMYKAAIELGRY